MNGVSTFYSTRLLREIVKLDFNATTVSKTDLRFVFPLDEVEVSYVAMLQGVLRDVEELVIVHVYQEHAYSHKTLFWCVSSELEMWKVKHDALARSIIQS
jgi:hypothetical protein